MALRLGTWVFTPNTVMLILALSFFLTLSYPRLRATGIRPGIALPVTIVCGAAGGWLYARLAGGTSADALPGAWDLHFGSFGGYWGALAGAAVCAWATQHDARRAADALVPGILAGAAVARLGCFFTGCCQGVPETVCGIAYFRPWPLYDLAALLITLASVAYTQRRGGRPGKAVIHFLIAYGGMRFLLEFARDAQPLLGPFTAGHLMAAIQIAAGCALCAMRPDRNPACS